MDWLSLVGPISTIAASTGAVVWGLVYWKGNQTWASRSSVAKLAADVAALPARAELDGLGARVSEIDRRQTATDKLADENHDRIEIMDRDLQHRSELMATSVVGPLQQIADRLEAMQRTQSEMLAVQATHSADMKALGRGLDEMRDRFNRREDAKP